MTFIEYPASNVFRMEGGTPVSTNDRINFFRSSRVKVIFAELFLDMIVSDIMITSLEHWDRAGNLPAGMSAADRGGSCDENSNSVCHVNIFLICPQIDANKLRVSTETGYVKTWVSYFQPPRRRGQRD